MPQTEQSQGAEAPDREDGLVVHDVAKSKDKELHLLVDDEYIKAYIKVFVAGNGAEVTIDEVMAFLRSHGVRTADFGMDSISRVVAEANETRKAVGPFVVAQGRKSVDGSDGAIAWLVSRPDAIREVRAGDRIDYRERKPVVNVAQGQKILRIVPPTPGQPGEDVFGKAIPCQAGRPMTIKRGKNVDVTGEPEEYFAQVAGMLEVHGDTVSVDPAMLVQGDVDMTVGNIAFIGPVKIAKDVRDGFHVKAGKEIEIGGMVEGALIESGASVKIHGGVAAKGKGRILCRGSLEARYLSEVYVETNGDVSVANSITNSTVKSLGKIMVNSGGIRGSNVVAQKGLRTPEIGSESGVRTVVIVGVDYHLKDQLVTIERELGVIREAVEKIEKALGPLLANGEIVSTLSPERADIARRLMAQLDMLVKQGNAIGAKRETLTAKMQVGADFYIEVVKKIYPGVIMQIGMCRRTFELEVSGPMRLYPDAENASVKVSRGKD